MTRQPPPLSGYRLLMGEAAWRRLHPAIQARFDGSEKARNACYEGIMFTVRSSLAGWLLAQFCRLIGTPLALHQEKNVPMQVRVYPDEQRGGLVWDRLYRFRHHSLNRVRSTKRIDEQSGLMECVGGGFGMYLRVSEDNGAIRFVSQGFFWQLGQRRLGIPALFTPGRTTVVQTELGGGQFRFTLKVQHPLLGRVFYQDGVFWRGADLPYQ